MKVRNIYRFAICFNYIILILASIFLFWKCRYGIANIDESFYLTIPYRLLYGDSLLLHEWHLSQMSSILLYPILKIYLLVFKSTEGILLNFRYIFSSIWCLSALFFYHRLKMFSRLGAIIASLSFLLYVPFGIMALSYNSMGILFLLLACTFMLTPKESRLSCVISGSCFAASILCCPFLFLLYIVFTLYSLLKYMYKMDLKQIDIWLFVSLGGGLIFLLSGIFILTRASVNDILQVLPYILQDPQHPIHSIIDSTKIYLRAIFYCNPIFKYCLVFFLFFLYFGRKQNNKCMLGLTGVCIIVWLMQIAFWLKKPYINFFMFSPCLLGLYCMVTANDKNIQRIFRYMWMPGLVYTFCINLTSNQRFYAISSVATIMTIASFLIMFLYTRKTFINCTSIFIKRITIFSIVLLCLTQIFSQFYIRYSHVFWETGIKSQTELIKNGPEKGILASKKALFEYEKNYKDIMLLNKNEKVKKVLFLSGKTWSYLCSNKEYSTYSAWLSGVNNKSIMRLSKYFTFFPHKKPDAIYIESQNRKHLSYYQKKGYKVIKTDTGNYMLFLKN